MNKYSRFFSFLLALLPGIFGSLFLQGQVLDWDYEDILTDTYQSGANPNMVIDAMGNIHVSYWQKETNQLIYGFRDKSTGSWTIEQVSQGTNTEGYTSALLVDPQGDIHIAYLADIVDSAYLAYAHNTTGSWTTEVIANYPSVGVYGSDQNAPSFIQHSLDITLQPDGNPAILFFDGKINSTGNCGAPVYQTYTSYELDLNIALNQGGNWAIYPFDDIIDDETSGCLPEGDRFGEFCKILPGSGGQYYAITNSLHNHDLLLYTSAPGDLTSWSMRIIDSTRRYFTVGISHFREGFDFIDAKVTSDNKVHLAYGISSIYGYGISPSNRKTFFYSAVNPDSFGSSGYTGFQRTFSPFTVSRTFYSIATPTPDNIFLTYYSANESRMVTANSVDGGNNWVHDTVMQVVTNTQPQSEYFGDSLFVLVYDAQKDVLRLASKSTSGGGWKFETVTNSEVSGTSISSSVVRNGSDDEIYLAYVEGQSGEMFLASRINQIWTRESVSPPGVITDNISLAFYQGGPMIVYREEDSEILQSAFRQGNNWITNPVTTLDLPRDVVLGVSQDSIFVAYFDLNIGGLKLARAGNLNGPWQIDVVDTTSAIVGRNISLTFDQQGTLHLSYVDVLNGVLKHAQRATNGQWTIENASLPLAYVPANTSIKTNSKNLPSIAFRNSTSNTMVIAEKDSLGSWNFSNIDGDLANLVGAPLRLLIDGKDKPWVLYNFVDSQDEMRLVRRDDRKNWNTVSITNNQAEISTVFDFHLVENDFYIIGKKNQLGNRGLGLLYAREGVFTSLNADMVKTSLEIYPNPSRSQINVSFSLAASEAVNMELYNLSGQKMHSFIDHQRLTSGLHAYNANLTHLSPGIYLIRVEIAGFVMTKKWVLLP
jgi:hypothetical protein